MLEVKINWTTKLICIMIMVNVIGKTSPNTSLHLGHLSTTPLQPEGTTSKTWQTSVQDAIYTNPGHTHGGTEKWTNQDTREKWTAWDSSIQHNPDKYTLRGNTEKYIMPSDTFITDTSTQVTNSWTKTDRNVMPSMRPSLRPSNRFFDGDRRSGKLKNGYRETKNYYKQPEPVFDTRITRNITVAAGQTADLGCRVFYLENRTVSWLRHDSMHILAAGLYTYISNIRYLARYNITEDTWFLTISEAVLADAGLFECQVSTLPVKSYFVRLNVVDMNMYEKQLDAPAIPEKSSNHPPAKSTRFVHKAGTTNKQFIQHKEPWAVMLGDSEVHVKAGSALNLTCQIKYLPDDQDIIRWIHNNKVLRYNQLNKKISIFTSKGEVSTSTLIIHKLKKYDSGRYKCAPGDINPVSVIVHVLEGEVISQLHVNGTWSSLVVPIISLIITVSILLILTSVRAIIGLQKRRQNRSVDENSPAVGSPS